jgi:hypothetical protein
MRICLRRTAHIIAERLISVQTDMQTDIDMVTYMAMDIGVKSVYIYGPSGLQRSDNQQVFLAPKVTPDFL